MLVPQAPACLLSLEKGCDFQVLSLWSVQLNALEEASVSPQKLVLLCLSPVSAEVCFD